MEYLDSELIILEVQKYPCLYDVKNHDFKNRDMKKDSWISVTAAVVGENWHAMDNENKTKVGKEVQKRWKSMKDSYWKSIKGQEGRRGGSAKSRKPYVFHKQMTFLQSVFQQKETSGNMNIEEANGSTTKNTASQPSKVHVSPVNSSRQCKKLKPNTFEQDIGNILKANVIQPTLQMPDPDEMFLLSQIPLIRQLNTSDKLDFQIKVMQLLQSYTKPTHLSPTSPYSTSTSISNPISSPSNLTSVPSSIENNVESDSKSLKLVKRGSKTFC